MHLFDDVQRTDSSAKKNGEGLFHFYNRSSRPVFETYRQLLQGWLCEMPADEAASLAQEMRSGRDLRFATGVCELIVHASLRRLGWDVEVHPSLPGRDRRPDFLVKGGDGARKAFVEVVTINPAEDEVAEENRAGAIYDTLNTANIPADIRLGYSLIEAGTNSPMTSRMKVAVETWANQNADRAREGEECRHTFSIGDWEFEVALFSGFGAYQGGSRIYISTLAGFSMQDTTPANMLSSTIQKKANRYGDFDAPFVVAVFDRTGLLSAHSSDFPDSVLGGLFGPELIESVVYADGQSRLRQRRGNGLWMRSGIADRRHNRVSAVLAFPRDDVWKIAEPRFQPVLVRNPNADIPLPDGILPYREIVIGNDECKLVQGRNAAEILGLPADWPPDDS